MSRGPGNVQRAILALIAANPDGAWKIRELCRTAYPSARIITKAHRVAVGRALRRIHPGTWAVEREGRDFWLCDPCSLASVKVVKRGYDPRHFEPGGMIYEQVEKAKRFRDASPIERINMQIADINGLMNAYKMSGIAATREWTKAQERILKQLKDEKDTLVRQAELTKHI